MPRHEKGELSMSTSIVVGIIGIILAIVLMNVLIYKGLNVVLAAVLVTFVIILTSGMPISDSWDTAVQGVGSLLAVLGPIIMFGAVMGVLYTKSGAAAKLANWLTKPFVNSESVSKKIVGGLAMFLILRVIFGLAGIDNMAIMYTMLAIAAGIFAKLDIPRKYLNALLMIAGTVGTLVPGAPMQVAIMAEQFIPGFDNSKSLVFRTLLLAIYVVGAVAIMYYLIMRDKKKGLHYEGGPLDFDESDLSHTPNVITTFIPVLIVYIFYNFVNLPAWFALLLGTLSAAALFGPYLPKENGKNRVLTIIDTMNGGVFLVPIAILFSMMPGFVMSSSPAYNVMIEGIAAIPIPAAIGMLIISVIIVGVAGNASPVLIGAVATATFIPAGLSPQAAGLILIASSVVLDTLPNSLGIITQCEITDCTMKECYPSIFRTTVLLTAIVALITALVAMTGII